MGLESVTLLALSNVENVYVSLFTSADQKLVLRCQDHGARALIVTLETLNERFVLRKKRVPQGDVTALRSVASGCDQTASPEEDKVSCNFAVTLIILERDIRL